MHVTFSTHLGCYQEYHIQSFKLCQIILRTKSPGLCQEKCLEKNISIFAVQVFTPKIDMSAHAIAINLFSIFIKLLNHFLSFQKNLCICLSRHFDFSNNLLSPSKCSFECNNSELLLHECGGETAYNVFLTGTCSKKLFSYIYKSVDQDTYRYQKTLILYCSVLYYSY